jgi:hypothetical protein
MPTRMELVGIVDYGRSYPAIDPTYFPNTPSSGVWSDSPSAGDSNGAWSVSFNDGDTDTLGRSLSYNHVRLVRGGQ